MFGAQKFRPAPEAFRLSIARACVVVGRAGGVSLLRDQFRHWTLQTF
jgi:hypothetical protein